MPASAVIVNTIEPLISMKSKASASPVCRPRPPSPVRRRHTYRPFLMITFEHAGPMRLLWPSSRHLAPKLRAFCRFRRGETVSGLGFPASSSMNRLALPRAQLFKQCCPEDIAIWKATARQHTSGHSLASRPILEAYDHFVDHRFCGAQSRALESNDLSVVTSLSIPFCTSVGTCSSSIMTNARARNHRVMACRSVHPANW